MGPRRFVAEDLGDPVLRREDGSVTYLFASAVDDAELDISHVIRGEDHVSNTALQIGDAAGVGSAGAAGFAHLPLIGDAAGRNFSKRLGALSLRSLREQGIEPLAIVLSLAAPGHRPRRRRRPAIWTELVAEFSLEAYGRATPKLTVDDLPRFSAARPARTARSTRWRRACARRSAWAASTPAFWQAMRGNLGRLEDAREWWEVCSRPAARRS